jgi:hypothetical protein
MHHRSHEQTCYAVYSVQKLGVGLFTTHARLFNVLFLLVLCLVVTRSLSRPSPLAHMLPCSLWWHSSVGPRPIMCCSAGLQSYPAYVDSLEGLLTLAYTELSDTLGAGGIYSCARLYDTIRLQSFASDMCLMLCEILIHQPNLPVNYVRLLHRVVPLFGSTRSIAQRLRQFAVLLRRGGEGS